MTTRKKVVKKKVAGKQMTTMADLEKKFAQEAQSQYESEPAGSSNYISIKGSSFSYQGEDIGDTMKAVIIADVYEHAHYDSIFDEDDPQPPGCFAIAEEESTMEPHGDSPNLQNEGLCNECWANEFGTDERGRGKACKNSRRLAILGVIEGEGGELEGIYFDEIPFLRVPATSLKNYSGYIKRSNKVTRRPSYAYVTELGFDDNYDYPVLTFNLVSTIDDMESLNKIIELKDEVMDDLMEPFDVTIYEPDKPKSRSKKHVTKKKVAKKKAAKRGRSKMS